MNKIKLHDSIGDAMYKLSEGNPGALTVLIILCENCLNEDLLAYLIFFDEYEIYGSKLYMLWNDCCNRNLVKLIETINYIRENVSKDKVHENLGKARAVSFI